MRKPVAFLISEDKDYIRVDKIIAIVNVEGESNFTNVIVEGFKDVISIKGSTVEVVEQMQKGLTAQKTFQGEVDPRFAEFNLINLVKFKLANNGKEMWLNYINRNATIEKTKTILPDCYEDGFYRMQMYEFMAIFGPAMEADDHNLNGVELSVMVEVNG